MSNSPTITVNVRSLAFGGDGVGEVVSQSDGADDLLGIVAFVPFTAVGERVSARVTERKKRHVKAELLELLKPSPLRVEPACEYFGSCGGCELQHLPYAEQLALKQEMVRGALQVGQLSSSVLSVIEDIVPSEAGEGARSGLDYRRRVNLHIDGNGRVGFYRANTRTVVPIKHCEISTPKIKEALSAIQEFGQSVQGKVSSVALEADDDGLVAVVKCPYDLKPTEQQEVLAASKKHFPNVTLMIGERDVASSGRRILSMRLDARGHLALKVPAGGFSQVNDNVNREMVQYVVSNLGNSYKSKVLDLYAGAGNFAVPLAKQGFNVRAVELDARLASFGRENAANANLQKNLEFVESSVEKFLRNKVLTKGFDTVIADPPRSGLGLSLVPQFSFAKRFVLVSCYVPSFVRDLKAFVDEGWTVESIKPFDMFAQTSYVEIVALLSK